MKRTAWGWVILAAANVVAWGVLGFQGRIGAAPQDVRMPFDNAVQQRAAMLQELQEIKGLIKEQNGLIRAVLNRTDPHDRKPKL